MGPARSLKTQQCAEEGWDSFAVGKIDLGVMLPLSEALLLRKEVIQPHLPIRLPCYDLILLADHTFGTSLPLPG